MAYTKDEVINEIKRVATQHGEPLSLKTFSEHALMSRSPVTRIFSTWQDACDEAGVEPEQKHTTRRKIDKSRALDDIATAAEKTDGMHTYRNHREHGEYDPSTIARLFGTWTKAKKLAGVIDENNRRGHSIQQQRREKQKRRSKAEDLHGKVLSWRERFDLPEKSLQPYRELEKALDMLEQRMGEGSRQERYYNDD